MKRLLGLLAVVALATSISFALVTPNTTDLVDYCTGANNSNCVYQIDKSGNVTGNNFSVQGTLSNTGAVSNSSSATTVGTTIYTPKIQSGLSITSTILPNATYVQVVSSGSAITMTSTPTISTTTAVNGQWMVISGTSSVSTVTLQDNGTLSGSQLELGAATRVLDNLKKLTLIFDSFDNKWKETSFGNN